MLAVSGHDARNPRVLGLLNLTWFITMILDWCEDI